MAFVVRLVIFVLLAAGLTRGAEPKLWISPNNRIIASADTHLYPDKPDRNDLSWQDVSFQERKGLPLASLSLEKGTGINRALVSEALWSPDSRFFVFSTWSSGGHSSWHSPTYVYDATTSYIYSIDDTIKSVTGESDTTLEFVGGDKLKLRFWDGENVRPEPSPRTIDLIEFVANHPKVAMGAKRFSQ
jgi:WD40 repeat protein